MNTCDSPIWLPFHSLGTDFKFPEKNFNCICSTKTDDKCIHIEMSAEETLPDWLHCIKCREKGEILSTAYKVVPIDHTITPLA